jgi:prepilin-type N-terminal cleavage/methylation domain-containing protein
MTAQERSEGGFTLVELMMAITVFASVSVGLFTVMLSAANGSRAARDVVDVSEESRLGFGRMVRDTREGQLIDSVSPDLNSFEVHVDFDGDNVVTPLPGTNSLGDYEELTYAYDPGDGTLRLNGEVLVRGVECARDASGNCLPVFGFGSNRLEFDSSPKDGVTSWTELDQAPASSGVGNGNNVLDMELPLISNVSFALLVREGDAERDFYAEAQLRNQR